MRCWPIGYTKAEGPHGGAKMTTPYVRSMLTALACTAAIACAAPAFAETVALKADMKASSEVPPTGSSGSGTLTAT
jgi:hypothetical protein